MEDINSILKQALEGQKEAQLKLGDIYSGIDKNGATEINESAAAHWYKTAFLNKNKHALDGLSMLAEKNNEAASSFLMNIYLNGDLNGEGRDLEKAFAIMQKISKRNTGKELSTDFIASWQAIADDIPDFQKAFGLAHNMTDDDKKNYALLFRPLPSKLYMPLPLNEYLKYTVSIEKEMLKKEGKEAEIIAPETEGGWGLSEEEAISIKTDDVPENMRKRFIISCEKPISGTVLFRHAMDLGLSNIHFELENQILKRGKENSKYDVLEYHVSGLPLSLLPHLRGHFEQAQKNKDERAAEINFYLHQAFLVIYHIQYWFRLPASAKK